MPKRLLAMSSPLLGNGCERVARRSLEYGSHTNAGVCPQPAPSLAFANSGTSNHIPSPGPDRLHGQAEPGYPDRRRLLVPALMRPLARSSRSTALASSEEISASS
jgi:hypothetical protein